MKAKELATPTRRVEILYSDFTIGDAVKKMEQCHYSMIPVIERHSNRYLYSVSTGDILHRIVSAEDPKTVWKEPLSTVRIERLVIFCDEDAEVHEPFELAINQNFIPLVDANGVFRGIITRRAILDYLIPSSEGE